MKILLAVDGSAHSQEAADEVLRRPWPPGSVVRVLSVAQVIPPPAGEFAIASATLEQLWQESITEAKRITTGVADSVKERTGLRTETAVREGDARSGIVDEANAWGADLVVVGSHGHTGLKRWLLGSVAQSVVSHSPCSVEVVRHRGVQQ